MRLARVAVLLVGNVVVVAADARSSDPLRYEYAFTDAAVYLPRAWVRGGERFPSGSHVWLVSSRGTQKVAPSLYASADAAVSFDAAHLLIGGKVTARSPWQIFEVSLRTGELRQLTEGIDDRIRPLYLPGGRIVYTRVSATASWVEILSPRGNTCRITFAGRYLTDDVLADGRILIEGLRPGKGCAEARELYTVYPDGTSFESLRCDHGTDRFGARQLHSGDIVFNAGSQPARITPDAAKQVSLPKLPHEATGPIAELAPGVWLLSLLRLPVQRFALDLWMPTEGRIRPAYPTDSQTNAVEPVVIAMHAAPRDIPSALPQQRRATAVVMCLGRDAVLSGAAAVEFFTRREDGSSNFLGDAPVADDGSFYVELPADRPLRMKVRFGGRQLPREQREWFWLRPGERRTCIGCHAPPDHAPENRVPAILERTSQPAILLHGAGSP